MLIMENRIICKISHNRPFSYSTEAGPPKRRQEGKFAPEPHSLGGLGLVIEDLLNLYRRKFSEMHFKLV